MLPLWISNTDRAHKHPRGKLVLTVPLFLLDGILDALSDRTTDDGATVLANVFANTVLVTASKGK